jgi:hypothetical protein
MYSSPFSSCWVCAARLLHPSSCWVGSACLFLHLFVLGLDRTRPPLPRRVGLGYSSTVGRLLCHRSRHPLCVVVSPAPCHFRSPWRFCPPPPPPLRFCPPLPRFHPLCLRHSAHPFLVVSALLFLFAVHCSHWGGGASGGVGVVQPSPACQQPQPLGLASIPLSLHRWNSRAQVFAARAEAGEARGGGGGPLSVPLLLLALSLLLSFTLVWFASTSPLSFVSSTC